MAAASSRWSAPIFNPKRQYLPGLPDGGSGIPGMPCFRVNNKLGSLLRGVVGYEVRF